MLLPRRLARLAGHAVLFLFDDYFLMPCWARRAYFLLDASGAPADFRGCAEEAMPADAAADGLGDATLSRRLSLFLLSREVRASMRATPRHRLPPRVPPEARRRSLSLSFTAELAILRMLPIITM